MKTCDCRSADTCHHITGRCKCWPGYTGPKCEVKCPPSTWGLGCKEKCHCEHGGACDPVSGTCNCKPGWMGEHCDKRCNLGYYGEGCHFACECAANEVCSAEDGCVVGSVAQASSIAHQSNNTVLIPVVLIIVLIITVIAFLVAFYYRRRFQQLKQITEPVVHYSAVAQESDRFINPMYGAGTPPLNNQLTVKNLLHSPSKDTKNKTQEKLGFQGGVSYKKPSPEENKDPKSRPLPNIHVELNDYQIDKSFNININTDDSGYEQPINSSAGFKEFRDDDELYEDIDDYLHQKPDPDGQRVALLGDDQDDDVDAQYSVPIPVEDVSTQQHINDMNNLIEDTEPQS